MAGLGCKLLFLVAEGASKAGHWGDDDIGCFPVYSKSIVGNVDSGLYPSSLSCLAVSHCRPRP